MAGRDISLEAEPQGKIEEHEVVGFLLDRPHPDVCWLDVAVEDAFLFELFEGEEQVFAKASGVVQGDDPLALQTTLKRLFSCESEHQAFAPADDRRVVELHDALVA